MEQRGFPPQDPLYQLMARAYQAMHHLYIELHYRSGDGGVGRPGRRDPARRCPAIPVASARRPQDRKATV
jgi:hypothetical protein